MTEDNVASILLKQQKLGLADQTLESVRCAGDLLVRPSLTASEREGAREVRVNYLDLFLSAYRGNLTTLRKKLKLSKSTWRKATY